MLPSTFKTTKTCAAVRTAPHNEPEARGARYASLEAELLECRSRLNKKYATVSPRVDAKTRQSPLRKRTERPTSPEQVTVLTDVDPDRLAVCATLSVSQVVLEGSEKRQFERMHAENVGATWGTLHVPKRVLVNHDVFLTTAGRVRPLIAITEQIGGGSAAAGGGSLSHRSRNENGDGSARGKEIAKGRCFLKSNSNFDAFQAREMAAASPRRASAKDDDTPRKHAFPVRKEKQQTSPQRTADRPGTGPQEPIASSSSLSATGPATSDVRDAIVVAPHKDEQEGKSGPSIDPTAEEGREMETTNETTSSEPPRSKTPDEPSTA